VIIIPINSIKQVESFYMGRDSNENYMVVSEVKTSENVYYVKETPEQIMQMIKDSE
jgi:hypothetical protein